MKTLRKILIRVVAAAPLWICLDCAAMLLSSVVYALNTVVKQLLFDTITEVVSGMETYRTLILITVFVVLFQIGNEFLNAVCNFTWLPAMKSVAGKLKQGIHKKIGKLPGNCFEDVEILEIIEKANIGADCCYSVYNSVATILLFYFPYFLVLGIYLWRLRPILVLALLFIFLPRIVELFLRQKISEKQVDVTVPLQREMDYYETELVAQEKVKENRLYGLYKFFSGKYRRVNQAFCHEQWQVAKKSGRVEFGMRLLTLAGYLGVIFLLVVSLLDGFISVGAFAAVFSSISTLIMFMNDAIGNYLGSLFDNVGVLKKYLEFFELPEDSGTPGEIGWMEGIKVEHLSFTYPGADEMALKDISFEIRAGETVALVGENGAGKTTLARILLGILSPEKGCVQVDGKDLFSVNPEGRRKYVSAVFQNFNRYQMSLQENIEISAENSEEKRLKESILQSELTVDERFEKGYDTMLSREFDGIDLSGGQWQRVALARGLYRESRCMVLDEPTSAIDPIEEGVLFRKFQNIIKNKMGVIVTHRLGSAKIADRIIVLQRGKLVEQGTHDELMKQNGYYATLYREQAKWY